MGKAFAGDLLSNRESRAYVASADEPLDLILASNLRVEESGYPFRKRFYIYKV
jgi:hypothetical protein